MSGVIWHDLECGAYTQDLPLWRELAEGSDGPILEIGAGTGRVALDLARHGHRVTALERDPTLAAELQARAQGLPVDVVTADARTFLLTELFSLCLIPMQTLQLLGGRRGRRSMLRNVRRHLAPRGRLAAAIVPHLQPFELRPGLPSPLPDVQEHAGVLYWSQPTAVRREQRSFVLERRREVVHPDGRHEVSSDATRLDRLSCEELEREAVEAGLRTGGRTRVAASADYVGSEVVLLDG